MIATLRRVAPLVLAAVLAGCGSSTAPSLTPRSPAAAPSLSPVPGAPSPTPALTPPPTSVPESNAAIGPIWDGLPPSWPTLPGQSESEIGTDASTILVVKGEAKALAQRLDAELTKLGWTVDVGSPLEDGSVVLDATHAPKGCKVEAQFFSAHDGTNDGGVVVYYGARCPFD